MFFDIGPMKLAALLVIATLVLGPDKLPGMITEIRDFIRRVRAIGEDAKQELREELGPQFEDFEFEDLKPRVFVAKHILSEDGLGLGDVREAFSLKEEAEVLREAALHASAASGTAMDLAESLPDTTGGALATSFDSDTT